MARSEVAAIILAAGRSERMGTANKLLMNLDGKPVIRHVAETACATCDHVSAVIGHEAETVRAALEHLPLEFTFNPSYAQGLSTSLRAGIKALPGGVGGVLICLADMPRVTDTTLRALIKAFDEKRAVMPVFDGRRGNPVLLPATLFEKIRGLQGDRGAKSLLDKVGVIEVEVDDPGVLKDLDRPEDFRRE